MFFVWKCQLAIYRYTLWWDGRFGGSYVDPHLTKTSWGRPWPLKPSVVLGTSRLVELLHRRSKHWLIHLARYQNRFVRWQNQCTPHEKRVLPLGVSIPGVVDSSSVWLQHRRSAPSWINPKAECKVTNEPYMYVCVLCASCAIELMHPCMYIQHSLDTTHGSPVFIGCFGCFDHLKLTHFLCNSYVYCSCLFVAYYIHAKRLSSERNASKLQRRQGVPTQPKVNGAHIESRESPSCTAHTSRIPKSGKFNQLLQYIS